MKTSKKPSATKPVKGWAIFDQEGYCQIVCVCDSEKFIWRKLTKPQKIMGKLLEISQSDYEKNGYRAIQVDIIPHKP